MPPRLCALEAAVVKRAASDLEECARTELHFSSHESSLRTAQDAAHVLLPVPVLARTLLAVQGLLQLPSDPPLEAQN